VRGLNASEAFRAAYPKVSSDNVRKLASRLATKDDIKTEIARMRAEAATLAGSAVLDVVEKRKYLVRLVCLKLTPPRTVTSCTRSPAVLGAGYAEAIERARA
jgi:hypothetical protein